MSFTASIALANTLLDIHLVPRLKIDLLVRTAEVNMVDTQNNTALHVANYRKTERSPG